MEAKTKILIVDDFEAIRRCFRMFLEKAGYEVLEAVNGREGLEMLMNESPDVVLTDLQMPEMDGLTFIANLKDYIKSKPVIVISGEGRMTDAIEAVRLGAWDYIVKPLTDMRELDVTIQRVLERARLLKENQQYREGLEEQVREQTKELRESKDRQIRLLESVTGYVYTVTVENGKAVDTVHRPGCEGVTGYAPDDYQADPHLWLKIVHEEDRGKVLELTSRFFENPVNMEMEHRLLHKTGDMRWILNTYVPSLDSNGELKSYDGIITDISDRKNAENRIKENEERYRIVCEQTGQLIYDYDIKSGLIVWSGAIEQVTGCSREEFNSVDIRKWEQLLHPDEGKKVVKLFINARHTSGQYSIEHKFQRKCGSYIHVRNHGVCCPDANGITSRMLGTIEDISESKKAEGKLKRHATNLASLRAIDIAISGSMELRTTLKVLLDEVVSQLKADAVLVMLISPQSRTLEYISGTGFDSKTNLNVINIDNSFAGQIEESRKNLIITDLKVDRKFAKNDLVKMEGFKSFVGIPLISKGELKGVLEIFSRTKFSPDQEWLDFAEALAGQAAIAIENAEMLEQMQRSNRELLQAYDSTIEGWSRALDYRDKETEGHSRRVTDLTVRIAKTIGMAHEKLAHMRRGALLHDIGKLGVPDNILLKPGKLTEEEFEAIKKHTEIAFRILSPIEFLRPALDIPYWHHEKWNGSGYPHGLKGEEIPLAARIFAVVDVWDALRSDRPYRAAWPVNKVIDHMKSECGIHFDPDILKVFIGLMEADESH